MGVRGRKSSTELTLVQRAEEVLVVKRPDPPDFLSEDAQAEWREVVNSLPADHFSRAQHPTLEAYCTSAAERRRIGDWIQDYLANGEGEVSYPKLLEMHDAQARSIAMLGVRLGILSATNVTRVRSLAGGREPKKPWEKYSR